MDRNLYEWLKNEWRISNHIKYQKYFEEWVEKLTPEQITGFNKMKDADYIKH